MNRLATLLIELFQQRCSDLYDVELRLCLVPQLDQADTEMKFTVLQGALHKTFSLKSGKNIVYRTLWNTQVICYLRYAESVTLTEE